MSTQQGPPSRPWFRLATMIRPPPPAIPTSQGPPPRPTSIQPAFAPTTTQSTPNPQPTPIPPLPEPNPTPSLSPPVPTTNGVAQRASDPPVTKPSSPSSPSPKPPQSSSLNTPPSQQSAPPQFAIVGSTSPPQAPQSMSLITTTITRVATPPSSPSKFVQQISSPPPPTVTPPATSPSNIEKISFSSPPPKSTAPTSTSTTPPLPRSAPPLEIFTSPLPAPQSTSPSPITTTHTLTQAKVVKPLEPIPTVNVATPPESPIIEKFLFSAPPTKTRLILSPSSSPPRPPPVLQQSEHPLLVSGSPQSSSPHVIKLPEKTSPIVNSPSQLKHKSYNDTHLEYKQKTMHLLEAKENPKDSPNGFNEMHIVAGNTHSSKHDINRKPETYMKHQDSQVIGKSVITIAGENKGALMRLTPSGDIKHHQFGNNRHNPTSSLETTSEAKNKHQNSNPLLMTSFLNSNVQGVNNSIIYNFSINHHDPGIHLMLSRKFDHGDCRFHP